MKATYSKNTKRFPLVMITISLLCCLITATAYTTGVSSFLASALGVVVTPIQKVMANVGDTIDNTLGYFEGTKELRNENARLKLEIANLNKQLSELAPAKKENEMLYNFLELKQERKDIQFAKAEIISRSASNYTSDFTLDKGSLHGIKKDMAVLTDENCLLGIIVEVGATYSRGKTLYSYDYSVGIKNERTGKAGIASGGFDLSHQNLLQVSDIQTDSDYAIGDIIRTSALGDIYPAGIYVGKVKELVPSSIGYTLTAIIEPAESASSSDSVMIITDFDRAYK